MNQLNIICFIFFFASIFANPSYLKYFEKNSKNLLCRFYQNLKIIVFQVQNQLHLLRFRQKQDQTTESSDEQTWNYELKGQDWKDSSWHCKNTNQIQSPIDLKSKKFTEIESTETLTFTNIAEKVKVLLKVADNQLQSQNNWFNIKLTKNEGPGFEYETKAVVFHSPSEHTIDGKKFDLEIQFSLTNQNDQKAILVIFGQVMPNRRNQLLEPFGAAAVNLIDNQCIVELDFKESFEHELLKLEKLEYISYEGSLTTPPCTGNTKQIIIVEPLTLSEQILKQFLNVNVFNGNGGNREIQKTKNQIEYIKGKLNGIQEEQISQSEEIKKKEQEIVKEEEKETKEEQNSNNENQLTGDDIMDIEQEMEKKNKEMMELVNKLKSSFSNCLFKIEVRQNELGVEEEEEEEK